MKKYFIIKSNLQQIFSVKKICLISIIFIYIFWVKVNSYNLNSSFSKNLENIFSGPVSLDNISEVINWTLYQAFCIFIIGNYIFYEMSTRSIYIIPRLKSKQSWHISIQITCFLACIIYFAFGSFIQFIGVAMLNKSINLDNVIDVFKIMFLLSLSTYYMVTVYIFNIIIIKSHIKSFLILILELYGSIVIGNAFGIDKYIPFNQGILLKHELSNFSYQWSFVFLTVLICVNLVFINRVLVKRDLLEIVY